MIKSIALSLLRDGNGAHVIEIVDPTFAKLRMAIGADYVEYVQLSSDTALMVDEEGMLRDREVNEMATKLAGFTIVGDALIINPATIDELPYE